MAAQPGEYTEYVLGTHDEEVERLGLQHRVWRARALDAWRRGGFSEGQTLLDVGCGPGYATCDLAEIVGPRGRVLAIDKSRRFLGVLEGARALRGLHNVGTQELDLDDGQLPDVAADGAWCRWVFAFVRRPRELLARIREALRPGATLVVHEYCDYRTWRLAPRSSDHEEFVDAVMRSWRDSGGEPDVGLELPRFPSELGFEVRSLAPIVEIASPSEPFWQWPRAFIRTGLDRLVALGRLPADRAQQIWRSFERREGDGGTLMLTPAVLEIVAERSR
jgi:SAM-dependent methyltransferase